MSWPAAEYNTTMTRTTTELLGSLKSGSEGGEGAWNELLKRYRPVVMKFARRLGLGEADAEDAAQQTLMELRSLYLAGRYDRGKGRLRSWLYGIARNQIRNSRKLRKHAEIQPADSAETTDFFDRIEDADHWEARSYGLKHRRPHRPRSATCGVGSMSVGRGIKGGQGSSLPCTTSDQRPDDDC